MIDHERLADYSRMHKRNEQTENEDEKISSHPAESAICLNSRRTNSTFLQITMQRQLSKIPKNTR